MATEKFGGDENKSDAVERYRRSAELGDAAAMNNLADCLSRGIGTAKNIPAAVEWYRKAAAAGNFDRVKLLATFLIKYFGDEAEAIEWLKKSGGNFWFLQDFAGDLDLKIMNALAEIYAFEMPDTPENKSKAFHWREKMAARNPRYGYDLAAMYWEGEGVEKNLPEALKLFRRSAEAGNSQSMDALAKIYLKGELVPKDEAAALEWLKKSFQQDFQCYGENLEDEALRALADIYAADENYLMGCDKTLADKKRAFELFQELDRRGVDGARYRIARMYELGEYVAQDKSKALEIYKSHADTDSEYCRKVAELYLELGNIPDAASFVVKYFDTPAEKFCRCALCCPFVETKAIAKFFIDAPNEEIIAAYGGRLKAARAVLDFGRACGKSPVGASVHLEVISKAAEIFGGDCPREILKYLAENYWRLYEIFEADGEAAFEGDALKDLLGGFTEALTEYARQNEDDYYEGYVRFEYVGEEIEFERHDADYYRRRAEFYRLKLSEN